MQVYVVGGDGTHRGANAISREAAKRKYAMTVPHSTPFFFFKECFFFFRTLILTRACERH